MKAGAFNRRVEVQQRQTGQDEIGQPIDGWVLVGKLWASIAGETGLGSIRSQAQSGVPANIARYSFAVRRGAAESLAVTPNMRLLHDGKIFDIKLITEDLNRRDVVYLISEQGGNDG